MVRYDFLKLDDQGPTEEAIRRFSCSTNERIVSIERLRTANGEPVVYYVDKVPESYSFRKNFDGNDEISF